MRAATRQRRPRRADPFEQQRARSGPIRPRRSRRRSSHARRPPSTGSPPRSAAGCAPPRLAIRRRPLEALRPAGERHPAGCPRLLGRDEQHGEPCDGARGPTRTAGNALPRLGRRLRRRHLAHRQRDCAEPGLEADQPRAARPELGRDADARSRRQERATRSTSAPARRTAAPPAARPASASTGRRTAASTGQKLSDACVSNATYPCVNAGQGRVPRPRDQLDRGRPERTRITSSSARRWRPRPLARDRRRRHDSRFEPGANEPGVYESTDGGETFTRSGTAKPDAASRSASPTSGSTRSIPTSSTPRLRRGRLAARRRSGSDRVPAGVHAAVQPRRGHRPHDVRPDA